MQRSFIILAATCVMSGLWGQVASAQVVDEQQRREAFKYYRAGQEFMYAEAWEKAIHEFSLAAQLDPLLTLAHYGHGRAHMELKNYSAAIRAFLDCREAFRTLFSLRETDKLKADHLRQEQVQELRDSLRLLESGRIRDANPSTVARMQARIRELGRDLFRGTPAQFQVPAEVSLALGSAYFRSGSIEAAEREYRAAIGANRKFGEAHNNLAVVLMMTGRLTEAQEELELAKKAGFRVNPLIQEELASRERVAASR